MNSRSDKASAEEKTDRGPRAIARHKEGAFYIPLASSHLEWRPRVLKQGDTFAVFDPYGDFLTYERGEEGLYFQDTRFLSHFLLRIGDVRALLLSSTIKHDNTVFTVDLTNPDFADVKNRNGLPRDTLHLCRSKILSDGGYYERVRIRNYGEERAVVPLQFTYDADFVDIFEVRGQRRGRRGENLAASLDERSVTLKYRGLDDVLRTTRIAFDPKPNSLTPTSANLTFHLEPGQQARMRIFVSCEIGSHTEPQSSPSKLIRRLHRARQELRMGAPQITTSNELFDKWLDRSLSDLYMLISETPFGPYPYAGIPWFSTPFGRDGLITALQSLWFDPSIARGVLGYLAATQSRMVDPKREAEPGKILHETRSGEMAALGEVPFGQYYGSVDATPLFVLLAGHYLYRTSDRAFIESIWPNIEAAVKWIDDYGDGDGDRFVEYQQQSPEGLSNQGCKDSADAVFHEDGVLAEGAIALAEVQGYVFAAKLAADRMAKLLGKEAVGATLARDAGRLQEQFDESFWLEDLGTYAIALDGEKRPCRVRTSNAGHAMFTGIGRRDRMTRLVAGLMHPTSFSGWGIRTLGTGEPRYNPMAYHNGSVWPHDNGLIALGLSHYGFKQEVLMLLQGLFDAAIFMDLFRLPELFCGFPHRPGEGPILYPVACAPQAWSSATALALLSACLGISFNMAGRQIRLDRPTLPPFLDEVEVCNLSFAGATVDLLFRRHNEDVAVNVTRRDGDLEVVAIS